MGVDFSEQAKPLAQALALETGKRLRALEALDCAREALLHVKRTGSCPRMMREVALKAIEEVFEENRS